MSATEQGRASQPRSTFAQWLGVVGPPLVWLTHFQAKYALAGNVPGTRPHGAMAAIGVVALLLVGGCALAARRQWRSAETSPPDRYAGRSGRARFMGALGLLSAALFALVIIAQLLADLFIAPGKS